MANPILSSDLYKDTGTILEAIDQLKALQKEYETAKKTIQSEAIKVEVALKKTTVATSEQREQVKKLATDADRLQKAYQKVEQAESEVNKQIQELNKRASDQNRIAKLQTQLANSAAGSYNNLAAQYALNKIRLNEMSAEQRKATKAGQDLEAQTKDIFEEMKRLNEATGQHTLSVGDYGKALRELPGAAGRATNAIGGLSDGLKALLRNPVVLVIGLIVGALATLFQAFSKSERGAQLLTKAAGLINGVMSELVDIANEVVDVLVWAFENPKAAMQDFWKALQENIVNRFQGLLRLIDSVGNGLRALWQRDLQGLKNAASDAASSLVQMSTGLDEQQQKDFAAAVREATKEVINETNAFIRLEEAKRRVRNANRELTKSIEQLITQEELYRATADDVTKSFAEREAAAEKAREQLEQRTQREIQLAKNNLSLINQEIGLRRANGEAVDALLDQQLAAYQAVIAAERDYTLAVRDNEQQRAELKQDRLERDLDILIDGFDNQKTINERLLRDDQITFEKRAEILSNTVQLAEDSFRKQIETIQQFTGIAVDANNLIAESDAVVLNQKIRNLGLSEIIEGRLLEIVRERRLAVQDLAEAERDFVERVKEYRSQEAFATLDALKQVNRFRDADTKKVLEQVTKITKESREAMEAEATKGEPKTIYDLLGFNLDDGQQQAFNEAINFAKDQLSQLADAREQAADRMVAAADREVEAAENALNREIELQAAGYANRVDAAQKELAQAKANQQKALEEQRKAQAAEQRTQTIQQATNLITASSKIFAQVGNPIIAIPLIALMWGTFIGAKIKAAQLTKEQYGEGHFETFNYGDSHASGNDIPLGVTRDGKQRRVERGEAFAVFNKRNVNKYNSLLPEIVQAINKGEFEKLFQRRSEAAVGIPMLTVEGTNTSRIESELRLIRQQGETTYYQNGRGQMVKRYKNLTRIYVN